jgi:hypothetical protein
MLIFPLQLALFQQQHYKKRISEAETIERRIWLRDELEKINTQLITHLN